MGFGDISYVSKDDSDEDGFGIGQVVAHVGASMADSFSVFGEFTATATSFRPVDTTRRSGPGIPVFITVAGSG